MPGWTDGEDETLTRLYAQGLSASIIAARFPERSRNSVIGRIHRLGLPGRATRTRSRVVKVPTLPLKPSRLSDNPATRAKSLRALHTQMKAAPELPTEPLPVLDEPGAGSGGGGVSLLDLENHMCRYPITRELPHAFCGARRAENSSYCREHKRICTSSQRVAPINLPVELTRDRRAA